MSAHYVSQQLSRIISQRELIALTGLSAATIGRMRRCGELPDPIRLSSRRLGWRTSDIEAWMSARVEPRAS
jgi:prophage regulatory protein